MARSFDEVWSVAESICARSNQGEINDPVGWRAQNRSGGNTGLAKKRAGGEPGQDTPTTP